MARSGSVCGLGRRCGGCDVHPAQPVALPGKQEWPDTCPAATVEPNGSQPERLCSQPWHFVLINKWASPPQWLSSVQRKKRTKLIPTACTVPVRRGKGESGITSPSPCPVSPWVWRACGKTSEHFTCAYAYFALPPQPEFCCVVDHWHLGTDVLPVHLCRAFHVLGQILVTANQWGE